MHFNLLFFVLLFRKCAYYNPIRFIYDSDVELDKVEDKNAFLPKSKDWLYSSGSI
jgi:hypothetical protein